MAEVHSSALRKKRLRSFRAADFRANNHLPRRLSSIQPEQLGQDGSHANPVKTEEIDKLGSAGQTT